MRTGFRINPKHLIGGFFFKSQIWSGAVPAGSSTFTLTDCCLGVWFVIPRILAFAFASQELHLRMPTTLVIMIADLTLHSWRVVALTLRIRGWVSVFVKMFRGWSDILDPCVRVQGPVFAKCIFLGILNMIIPVLKCLGFVEGPPSAVFYEFYLLQWFFFKLF